MKHKMDYRPKYGLSIKYLKLIMPDKELKNLIDKYVKVKIDTWKNSIRGKK
jgi:hypothetical protein